MSAKITHGWMNFMRNLYRRENGRSIYKFLVHDVFNFLMQF